MTTIKQTVNGINVVVSPAVLRLNTLVIALVKRRERTPNSFWV
jgi:hypothetical protein